MNCQYPKCRFECKGHCKATANNQKFVAKIFRVFWIIIFIIASILAALFFTSCSSKINERKTTRIKQQIKTEKPKTKRGEGSLLTMVVISVIVGLTLDDIKPN